MKNKNKPIFKQALVICCIIVGLSIYLYGCYEINYYIASKMKWWELGLIAVGMVCPLIVLWAIISLGIGRLLFFDVEITYD